MCVLHAGALLAPGSLRLGRLHLPVYGIFAAAGLISALWLSQRTARLAGLAEDKLWDAGVFAVVAAFVASRALLVATNLRAFVQFPLLVLALPSLTYGGMVLTAVMVWLYLRWKGLPWRDVLDAWVPCAALLAAVLSVGHFVEGTEAGMPTSLSWGVHTAGDTVLGKVHPVQLYAAACALVLCAGSLWKLRRRGVSSNDERRGIQLRGVERRGETAAGAMMVGGAAWSLLDMLRQPVETFGASAIEPPQVAALAMMVAGGVLWLLGEGRELS